MDQYKPNMLRETLDRIRRRRTTLAVIFLFLPLAVLNYYYGPGSHAFRTVFLLAWVALYAYVMLRVAWSRCPRCQALFFAAKPLFRINPFRNRCGACDCSLSGEG